MKKTMMIFIVFCSAIFAQDRVHVTIYNQNRALVKEIRSVKLRKGTGLLSFKDVASQIDPTSVYFISKTCPDKLYVIEQNFEYDLVGSEKILSKYIDKKVSLTTKDGNEFKGILLSNSRGDVVLKTDSGIEIVQKNILERFSLPKLPAGLITKPTLVWQVNNSGPEKQDVEVTYLTTGMNWHAEYIAVIDEEENKLDLTGWVSINNNTGKLFRDAKIKLIAGDVHIAREQGVMGSSAADAAYLKKAAPQLEEKQFFEYHMYTLNRLATIKNNQIKQITLFPSARVNYKKTFTFDERRYNNKIAVRLVFENNKKSGLGIPLREGKIRVYKKDSDGSQEFIGEDNISHTPKGEKINLLLGNAFDLTGKRKMVSVDKTGKKSRKETIEIILKNHKDIPVTIYVYEHLWGNWKIVKSSHKYNKKDSSTIKFAVQVEPDSTVKIEYTSVISW